MKQKRIIPTGEPVKVTKKEPWRNRICGYSEEPPDDLLANISNWRVHPQNQQRAMKGILTEVGIVQNVIVNKRTNRVIDGHMRIQLGISEGLKSIPVTWVDLSEEEEQLILAALDPVGDMAVADDEMLGELIKGLDAESVDLNIFLNSLYDESTTGAVKDVKLGDDDEKEKASTSRVPKNTETQIKAVLFTKQVSIFEKALLKTGLANRGEAIVAICKAYLDGGQHDELAELEDLETLDTPPENVTVN